MWMRWEGVQVWEVEKQGRRWISVQVWVRLEVGIEGNERVGRCEVGGCAEVRGGKCGEKVDGDGGKGG